jgi:hypothetical protein
MTPTPAAMAYSIVGLGTGADAVHATQRVAWEARRDRQAAMARSRPEKSARRNGGSQPPFPGTCAPPRPERRLLRHHCGAGVGPPRERPQGYEILAVRPEREQHRPPRSGRGVGYCQHRGRLWSQSMPSSADEPESRLSGDSPRAATESSRADKPARGLPTHGRPFARR